MIRKTLAAALLATLSAGTALADDITVESQAFVSSRTRAEVQADLQQFQRVAVNPWAQEYDQLQAFRSGKSRTQVSSEYIAARDQVSALTGEDSGAAWLAARPQGNAPVLAGQPVNAQ